MYRVDTEWPGQRLIYTYYCRCDITPAAAFLGYCLCSLYYCTLFFVQIQTWKQSSSSSHFSCYKVICFMQMTPFMSDHIMGHSVQEITAWWSLMTLPVLRTFSNLIPLWFLNEEHTTYQQGEKVWFKLSMWLIFLLLVMGRKVKLSALPMPCLVLPSTMCLILPLLC